MVKKGKVERKKAEHAVQEAREYAESILATVREPLVVLDGELRVVSANRSFYQTFQVTPEETKGNLIYDLGKRQWDIPKLRDLLEDILSNNNLFTDFEVEHEFPTLGRRMMLLNARRIYRETNKTETILLAIEDITERKKAEEGLETRREHLEELVEEHTAELKQEIEERKKAEGELELRNKIATIFLTIPDEKMYGEVLQLILNAMKSRYGVFGYIDENGALVVPSMTRDIWDKCQVPEKEIVFPRETWGDSIWPRAIREKKTLYSNERSARSPKGHIPILRNITSPIVYRGKVIGLLQVANKEEDYDENDVQLLKTIGDFIAPVLSARLERDMAEESEERFRRLSNQLAAANKELESFSYSVSHDMRAPLRSIDGFSQALLEDCGERLDEKGKDYLKRVRAATKHMEHLIEDILEISRLTRRKMKYERVDLSAVAQDIAAELQKGQPERNVEFVIQKGLVANGDALLLGVMMENLIGNAWKFSSKHPRARIEFGITAHDGGPAYFVRDDGAGFDMAYVDKLFCAFQRLHAPDEFPGTGIGLATVQRIVHRHGGRTWAEGEVEGGATFYFTLQKDLKGGLKNEE